MARKTTELVPLMLRLREGLRKKLERAAKTNDVSMNQEITDRLEYSFEREKQEAFNDEFQRDLVHGVVEGVKAVLEQAEAEGVKVKAFLVQEKEPKVQVLVEPKIDTDPKPKEPKDDEGAS
jgi:hypothetical protein